VVAGRPLRHPLKPGGCHRQHAVLSCPTSQGRQVQEHRRRREFLCLENTVLGGVPLICGLHILRWRGDIPQGAVAQVQAGQAFSAEHLLRVERVDGPRE
jgi:hypothetical protein